MRNLLALLLVCIFSSLEAQTITKVDLAQLRRKEDSLLNLAKEFITNEDAAKRIRADSAFIRSLVRALQIKNSFLFPFSNLKGISNICAPDSSFRIFTWNLQYDENYSRQRGVIQMNTKDGVLKMFPLKDFSEFSFSPIDSVRTAENWIGAIYFDVIKTSWRGQDYYTLLGLDNNNIRSSKKWIEVLSFKNGLPIFGGPFFSFENDSIVMPAQHRYNIEYKKGVRTLMRYDSELNMIVYDDLVSETEEPENKYTYIPDGDFQGFVWKNGKWVHLPNAIFTLKLKNGEFPMPHPLKDDNGNNNEELLWEQSLKNRGLQKKN